MPALSRLVRSRISALRPLVLGGVAFVASLPACDGGGGSAGIEGASSNLESRSLSRTSATPYDTPSEIPIPPDTIIPRGLNENVLSPRGGASLGVTDFGEARYHVPISVPPGRNGMQPELSLDYASGAGDGLYGVGWQLNGLPRITRCRQPSPPSGASAPLTYDTGDSFCLNGEQLVPTSTDGTQFHTFRDRAALVTAHDPDNHGPTWFEERTKDGRIYTFGGTSDSRVEPSQLGGPGEDRTVRLGWGVSQIADRPGNFLKVAYTKSTGGDILPSQIDYTGSASDPTTQRRLTFTYDQARPDVDAPYVAGVSLSYPDRLTEIRMFAPNPTSSGLVRTFALHYQIGPTTGRSLLSNVVECDQEPYVVIPPPPQPLPTIGPLCRGEDFSYTDATRGFDLYDTGITDVATKSLSGDTVPPQLTTLDVDGDGRADLLYRTASEPDAFYHLRLSTGTGFGPDQETSIVVARDKAPFTTGPHPLDFDGDGHTDVLASNGTPDYPGNYIYRATQQNGQWTLGPNPWEPDATLGYRQVEAADLNGDRFPDLILANPQDAGSLTSVSYAINLGGSFNVIATPADFGHLAGPTHLFADVNGDGRTELLTYANAVPSGSCNDNINDEFAAIGVGLSLANPTGNGATSWVNTFMPSWRCDPSQSAPDPTCKANEDMCFSGCEALGPSSPAWLVCEIACGYRWSCPDVAEPRYKVPYFGDFNGDHLADVIEADDTGALSLYVSTGETFDAGADSKWTSLAQRTMDWNLDGKADLIQRDTSLAIRALSLKHAGGPGSFNDSFHSDVLPISNVVADDQSDLQQFVVLDVNGDGLDDLLMLSQGSLQLYVRKGDKPDLLSATRGTFGPATTVSYKPFVGPDASSDCKLPMHCVTGGMWVVDTTTEDNGLGGANSYQHTFQNGRVDLEMWGFLGFETHTIADAQTGTTTTRTFDLTPNTSGPVPYYPLVGQPVTEVTTSSFPEFGQTVTRTQVRYTSYDVQGPGPYTVFPFLVTEATYDTTASGAVDNVTEHLVRQSGDAYGNLVQRFEQWPLDSVTQTTTITYQNRPDVWLVDLPRLKTVTNTANGESMTRQTGYEFDGNGMIFRLTQDPGTDNGTSFDPLPPQADGVQTLYTEYDRNPNGLPYQVAQEDRTDGTGQVRFSSITYDSLEGMFPVYSQDTLGHSAQTAYHPAFGLLAVRVDENGLTTRYQYDGFGRIRAEHPVTGDDRTVSYNGPPAPGTFGNIEDHRLGAADVVTTLDSLDREVQRAESYRGDGQTVYVTTEYDAQGHVHAVSRPFFAGATPAKTTTSYDPLGRVTQVTYPDGSSESVLAAGEQTITQDPAGNLRSIMRDSLGHPVKSTEMIAAGHNTVTLLTYGPFGTLEKVTDTAGNTVQTFFDRRGRPRVELDPDAGGARKYVYDAFGDETDTIRGGAWNGTDVTGGDDMHMTYDADGRLTTAQGPHWTRTQTWDTAPNGVGKLAEVGMHSIPSIGTFTDFAYDSLSRLSSKTWGMRTNTRTTTIGYGYDANSRPATLTYPAVPGRASQLVVRRNYSAGGQLLSVTDDTTGTAYWALESSDASEAFTKAKFGNGVETTRSEDPQHPGWLAGIASTAGTKQVQSLTYHWDAHARLRGRDDGVQGTHETFDYDGVDRLVHWSWSSASAARAVRYDYADIGNLLGEVVESGAGTSVTYTYDPTHFGPHQPASDGDGAFTYDAHGNQTGAPKRTVVFNEFDRPQQITTSEGTASFTYDGQLRRNIWSDLTGETIFSYDGLYERRLQPDGSVHHLFSISANGPVAQIEDVGDGTTISSESITYLHVDHHGSVVTLTDEKGKTTPLAYDPFGARVQPGDPSKHVTTASHEVHTGFTGHEHEDDGLALIDMVGRVYDPLQHRFLSEDPIRPDPTRSQALSPYAYVFNDPLNWTDPTGYDGEDDNGFSIDWNSGSTTTSSSTTDGSFDWFQTDYTPEASNFVELVDSNTAGGTEGYDGESGPSIPDSLPGDEAPDYEWQGRNLSLGQCAADSGCWANYGPADYSSPRPPILDDGGAWARNGFASCYGWTCQTALNFTIHRTTFVDPYVVVGIESGGDQSGPFGAPVRAEGALVFGVDHELGFYVASLVGVGGGGQAALVNSISVPDVVSFSYTKAQETILWSSSGVSGTTQEIDIGDGEIGGFGGGGWRGPDGEYGGYIYRELGPLFIGPGVSLSPIK